MNRLSSLHRLLISALIAGSLLFALADVGRAQQPFGNFEEYEANLLERPDLRRKIERQVAYPEGLTALWQRALDRNDAQLSRLVIDSIAIAKRRGVPGIGSMRETLIGLASDESLDAELAVALSNALVSIGTKEDAEVLIALADRFGPRVEEIIEPVFANWEVQTMEDRWIDRLLSGSRGDSSLTRAMEGLAQLGAVKATPVLQRFVRDEKRTASLRLVAARALAEIKTDGSEPFARELAGSSNSPFYQLLAITVLGKHQGEATIQFLTDTLKLGSNAIDAEAVRNLYRIDPALVENLADTLSESDDANVRKWVIESLADAESAARIPGLTYFLNDVNPHLRRKASEHLIRLADSADLRTSVIDLTTAVQNEEDWRGCEQACYVLARLNHAPSGARMVELLGHERGDVKVAAAWGLHVLRLPEHLPAMLEHAQSVYDGFKSGQLNALMRGLAEHQALLFNSFGDQLYEPAEELMMAYVPKDFTLGVPARVAAVWAMGMLHEDDPIESLVSDLIGRLKDNGQFPELEDVRNMSAVSLGRMRADAALESLELFAEEGLTGCHWALERMIGKKPPKPRLQQTRIDDWFLSPVPKP